MKVKLMCGIPGSGKSHYVKTNLTETSVICSADHFFTDSQGRYNYTSRLLPDAHGQCVRKFTEHLERDDLFDRTGILWVDNTNISAIELAPYVALCNAYHVSCEVITVKCDPEVAFGRQSHGVPLSHIQRMAHDLAERDLPRFWEVKFTNIG